MAEHWPAIKKGKDDTQWKRPPAMKAHSAQVLYWTGNVPTFPSPHAWGKVTMCTFPRRSLRLQNHRSGVGCEAPGPSPFPPHPKTLLQLTVLRTGRSYDPSS